MKNNKRYIKTYASIQEATKEKAYSHGVIEAIYKLPNGAREFIYKELHNNDNKSNTPIRHRDDTTTHNARFIRRK